MKANQEQYNECVELYNKIGPSAIYEYAEKNGITSSSFCELCDVDTPDTDDDCCLCCGSQKEFNV
jgi:hypothetical protein